MTRIYPKITPTQMEGSLKSVWEKVFGPKKYTSKNGDKISKTSDGKLIIERSRDTDKGTKQSTYKYKDK